jgi:hypothetical protein
MGCRGFYVSEHAPLATLRVDVHDAQVGGRGGVEGGRGTRGVDEVGGT